MTTKRKRITPPPAVTPGELDGITLLVRVADGMVEAVCAAESNAKLNISAGKPLSATFPDAAARLAALVDRCAVTSKLITLDLPLPGKHDPIMRCICAPVPAVSGSTTHATLAITPLPPQVLNTSPPQVSSEMNIILAALADGVIIYDRDGDALYYNPAALEILGWKQAGIDPRAVPYEERMAVYQVETVQGEPHIIQRDLVDYMQMDENTEHTWRMRRPDGKHVYVNFRPALIRDDLSGEIIGAAHLLRDVTAWRESDAVKDEFLQVASHELRAPLQPLILASRFIQRWASRPERAADLNDLGEQVVLQAKRMSLLVQDMLDMTRINAGRFNVQPTSCDLATITRNVVEEQRAVSHREILLDGAEAALPILAESERIWQALTNLINNAVKYSEAPAPVSVLLTKREEGGTTHARVMVQDRGCGIPAEHLPRIFERFYRASVTYQLDPQQQDGLGLGLYITQAIVSAHGGRIWAESTVGEGSTFYIELPLMSGE